MSQTCVLEFCEHLIGFNRWTVLFSSNPLGLCSFSQATYYAEAISLSENPKEQEKLCKFNFGFCFQICVDKSSNAFIAENGFASTAMFPFNEYIVEDCEFLSSTAYSSFVKTQESK